MNDFTILHLSDLHIDFSGKKLPILMENLLRDIENEMRFSSNIIIVVTGDLIHKADYHSADGVVEFFSRLKEKLQDRVKHIYIVPGNHDKERNALDREISERYLSETDVFYELYWKYLRLSFEKHLNLTEQIYRIFYGEDAYKYILRNTFGVRIDQVNGNNICFLLFNSAWNSGHEEDARNLDIGAFQIEEIKKSYVEKCE